MSTELSNSMRVCLANSKSMREGIFQADGLKDRSQLVIAVGAFAKHPQDRD